MPTCLVLGAWGPGLRASGGAAVDLVPQLFAGLERGHAASRDLDGGARLRVTSRAGRRLADGERAEAAQIDPLALRQTIGDGIDERVDRQLHLLSLEVLLLRHD